MVDDFFASLRAASFRGVSFDVPQDGSAFGRRIQTHEYPGRDDPYHEDLGLSVQGFSVEAIIHGADFVAQAAALETALKTKGPGLLVHPLYGDLDVVVKSATRRHSSDSAGEVSFSITFEKYGKPIYPTALRGTAAGLDAASNAAFNAINTDFIARYRDDLPDFLMNDSARRVALFAETLTGALKNRGVWRVAADLIPSVWITTSAGTVSGEVLTLFRSLSALASPVISSPVGSLSIVTDAVSAIDLMTALRETASFSVSISGSGTTSAQAARVANAFAIDALFRLSSLSAAVGAAQSAEYESREAAISMRTEMADALSILQDDLGAAGWDASWRAAGNLLASLSRDINDRIGRLPRTARIRTSALRPSLALANRLYGDDPSALLDRAADIVTRNRVRHPGFVPAGEMEVLIDAV